MAERENGYVDKAAILGACQRRFRDVRVRGLGRVRLRSLSERERSDYEASFLNADGQVDPRRLATSKVALIALCAVNDKGERIFSDDDWDALGEVDSTITNILADACREHCGFTAEDVEGLEGN